MSEDAEEPKSTQSKADKKIIQYKFASEAAKKKSDNEDNDS